MSPPLTRLSLTPAAFVLENLGKKALTEAGACERVSKEKCFELEQRCAILTMDKAYLSKELEKAHASVDRADRTADHAHAKLR